MESARRWSDAGGRDLLVYAISVQNMTAHRVDTARESFWQSHLYGLRGPNEHGVDYNAVWRRSSA